MPTYTRASRDYRFVPGLGGHMTVQLYDAGGNLINPVTLDIKQWATKHLYINKNTTHSGSNGATLRTRVGDDWTFACELDFPASLLTGGGSVVPQFVEQLVGSTEGVRLVFNVGDPEYWTERSLDIRTYECDRALIDTVDTVTNSTGTEIVGYNVTGSGASLLQACLNGVAVWAPVWN